VRTSHLVLKSCFTIKSLDIWAGRSRLQIPEGVRFFPPFQTVWTVYRSHPPSYSKDNGAVLSTGANGLRSGVTACHFTKRIRLCFSHGCQNELRPYSIKWLVSVLQTQYLLWAISKKVKGDVALSTPWRSIRGAVKSVAPPTSRYILFDGENISFDASLIYI